MTIRVMERSDSLPDQNPLKIAPFTKLVHDHKRTSHMPNYIKTAKMQSPCRYIVAKMRALYVSKMNGNEVTRECMLNTCRNMRQLLMHVP